jgi:hypothetical protein
MGKSSSKDLCGTGTVVETVAVAFDLLGEEVLRAPHRLVSVLQSKEFAAALQHGLLSEARRLKDQVTSPREGATFVLNMSGAATDAGENLLQKEIRSSTHYRQLEADAKALAKSMKCRAMSSPVGIWINESEKKLVVVGVIALLGVAAAVIYDLRAHGASSSSARAGKKARDFVTTNIVVRKVIGTIELLKHGNTILNFKPSDGSITLDAKDSSGWHSLYAGLAITGIYYPQSLAVSATMGAEAKFDKVHRGKAQSTVSYKPGTHDSPPLQWSVSVGLSRALEYGASLDFTANVKPSSLPSGRVPDVSSMLILSVPF